MRNFIYIMLFTSAIQLSAQNAPNFNVKDSNGKMHNLYADYLDKGKIVVLKIFFVDCPPCNAIAPATQQKYVDWGSGNGNVQFIEMTNKIGDTDSRVNSYKNKHSISFPSISSEGGSLDAIIPYTNGTYGTWSGTPFFAVIAANKKVTFDVLFSNLSTVIASVGGTMQAPPNAVALNIASPFSTMPEGVSLHLKSNANPAIDYNITQLTNGSHQFQYPSTTIPVITDPYFTLVSSAPAFHTSMTVSDMVTIRNHILTTIPMTKNAQKVAADVNNDGKIAASDLVILQKVIAGLLSAFPNNVPSYKMIPATIPLTVPSQGGATVNLEGEIVKMGNVK